jgi:hypothetical protein
MSSNRRTGALVAVIVVVVVVVVAIAGRPGDEAYGLDSTDPSGYKGLRLILEDLGTTVESVDLADLADGSSPFDAVYLPARGVPDDATATALEELARSGGHVVVGGGLLDESEFIDDAFLEPTYRVAQRGDCDVTELADSSGIRVTGDGMVAAPRTQRCYGEGRSHVVADDVGEGRLITISSPDLFTNEFMRAGDDLDRNGPLLDNSVVAVRLLQVDEGAVVAVVTEGIGYVGPTGSSSIGDLIGPGVKLGLWQLAVAFGFYALWRAIRPGRLIEEPTPVELASSDLTAAVGNMMQRRADPADAATALRADALRRIRRRLSLDPAVPPDVVAALVADRTGREPSAVFDALAGAVPQSDAQLVALDHVLTAIRQEVTHDGHPVGQR